MIKSRLESPKVVCLCLHPESLKINLDCHLVTVFDSLLEFRPSEKDMLSPRILTFAIKA